jgi:hypothetical protein
MQSRNANFSPLFAIVSVVIIRADHSHIMWPQHLSNAPGQGGFTSGTVSHNAKDNWAIAHDSSIHRVRPVIA